MNANHVESKFAMMGARLKVSVQLAFIDQPNQDLERCYQGAPLEPISVL